MARPTKLTAKLQSEIVANLEAYCHRSIAAKLADVDPATVRRWMAEGRENPEGPCGAFCAAILKAESRAERTLIRRVADATKEDPRQAQWLLTHRYPKRWAERDEQFEDRVKAGIRTEARALIALVMNHLAPEHMDALRAAADAAVAKAEARLEKSKSLPPAARRAMRT